MKDSVKTKNYIDFKSLLQQEFISRCKNNQAYSLRAFAANLKINHTSLSRILSGKRALTKDMIERLGLRLGLAPLEIAKYQKPTRNENVDAARKALQITTDQFHFISEWYHLAFLELIKVEASQDLKLLAKRLDIKVTQLQAAVDSLTRLGLLKRDEKGNFIDLTNGQTDSCAYSFTSEAKKKYQKQVFTLAQEAIDKFEIDERSHSGMTMAINSKKIAEAKVKIASFREELCAFLQEGELDEVYHLGVGLFPLTTKKQIKNKNKENKK